MDPHFVKLGRRAGEKMVSSVVMMGDIMISLDIMTIMMRPPREAKSTAQLHSMVSEGPRREHTLILLPIFSNSTRQCTIGPEWNGK